MRTRRPAPRRRPISKPTRRRPRRAARPFGAIRDRRKLNNLSIGLQLAITHPGIPICADCAIWLYDTKTWKRSTAGGRDLPRPKGVPTPCHQCPKGTPDSRPHPEKELTASNWQALNYYYLCEVDHQGILPVDRLTLRNNALIRMVLDGIERDRANVLPLLTAMAFSRR